IEPPLPATLIFEHPTIEAIARHLVARLFPDTGKTPVKAAGTSIAVSEATMSESDVRAMSDADIALLLEQQFGSSDVGRHQ
ncbi:MAG: acyl carrier protein, partial [Gemmatimonadaceae bacterium]